MRDQSCRLLRVRRHGVQRDVGKLGAFEVEPAQIIDKLVLFVIMVDSLFVVMVESICRAHVDSVENRVVLGIKLEPGLRLGEVIWGDSQGKVGLEIYGWVASDQNGSAQG